MYAIEVITPLGVYASLPEYSTRVKGCEFLKDIISGRNTLMFNTEGGARVFLPADLLAQSVLRLIEVEDAPDTTDDDAPPAPTEGE